ncbi:MAG TPA: TRAP transporter substrate-binding protein DctP, partial [Gammaproteobacteria bacterium]|nr:TRAP transporter substrate-binding protein DctP [Gammaproteobacteria bacterium]
MVTRRAVVQALAACATAGSARPAERQASLTAADVHPKDYPTVAAVGWINEQLAAEFGGELTLRQYHSGQLGSEKDTLELARIGALAITRVHSSVLNNVVPATRILSLPYVFDSTEHMRRAFDGRFG